MNRQRWVMGGFIALAVTLVLLLWTYTRRVETERATPEWSDPHQPPLTIGSVDPAASWAANRCLPMAACCGSNSAGRRVRRHYDGNLSGSPQSFIRTAAELEARAR
jgi:hypothetical protein